MSKKRILTGYRPTGKLHLGHYFGNLESMMRSQEEYDAFFFIADWHALTSHWNTTSEITKFTEEMVLDWCASGIDPEKATVYRQSDVEEVAELMLYFAMITPLSWLERVPTYKEQRAQLSDKDLSNIGFLQYPLLMTADIALFRTNLVPVGEDQIPHMELAREIIRRFNSTYGNYLLEPKAQINAQAKRVPGLDGRKMSKSYGNSIFISDSPDELRSKAMSCMTDPARQLKTDPGNPDICPLHQIHKLVGKAEEIEEWDSCCRNASCGCVAHKKAFAEDLISYFAPFRERRAEFASRPNFAKEVLESGAQKARPVAQETIKVCRELIGIDKQTELSESIHKTSETGKPEVH